MLPSRNIRDFFKPFISSKRKTVSDEVTEVNIGTEQQREPCSPRPKSARLLRSGTSLSTAPASTRESPIRETIESAQGANLPIASFSSALSSLPSALPSDAGLPKGSTRVLRQLSPLSSGSSKSPTPKPASLRAPVLSPSSINNKRPAENINMSFASTSTLSAPPFSSQSSSRRIVKDGQLAVTNSDSDSMDADDEPLDEIEEMIRQKRLRMASGSHTPAPVSVQPPQSETRELRSSRRDRPATAVKRSMSPPRKKYKFNLANLIKQSKTEAAWNEKKKVYEEQSLHDSEQEALLTAFTQSKKLPALDEVADQLGGENGDAQEKTHIVRAMKRMDALQDDTHYHFFKSATLQEPRPKFPLDSLEEESAWKSIMSNQASRADAFKTGFVADMASVLPLPDEVIQWVLRELLHEKQPQLLLSYVCTVDAHFQDKTGTLETLRTCLLEAAGRNDVASASETGDSILIGKCSQPDRSSSLVAIRFSCMLIGKMAPDLPISEQRSWLHVLMLVLIDCGVQSDRIVKEEVQLSLVALIEAVPSDRLDMTIRAVGLNILTSVPNPILIHRLLSSLPSSSSETQIFKRRLALSYFMKSEDYLVDSLDNVSITAKVAALLHRNIKFKIRENTDYEGMTARIGILDIAIGAGFSDFDFLIQDTGPIDNPVVSDKMGRRPPPSEEEKAFNEAIDSVVAELRLITSNIRDAGAAHMQRIECKGMLDRVSYRLEYAARTRPKPKKSAFGRGSGGPEAFKGFLLSRVELQQDGGAESSDLSVSK